MPVLSWTGMALRRKTTSDRTAGQSDHGKPRSHPKKRKKLISNRIPVKRNVWISAAATILPGVTNGENAMVAAGAVVAKDVPPNTVVAGVPAEMIKNTE